MTYTAQETSVQSGAPIELYSFTQGVSAWYYTSSEADYIDLSESPTITYASTSIDRSEIAASQEKARNTLTITVPRTNEVAELFRIAPPSDTINITVRRVHRGDTASVIVIWVGRVLSCVFEGPQAVLDCEPITVSLARSGLRRVYGRACPHVLYGTACGVVKASFAHNTTVAAISGAAMVAASYDAYTYSGGFVEWVNEDGNTERRFIETAATGGSPLQLTLNLLQPFTGIAVNDAITIYPGCNHTLTTCDATFSNSVNYGGWPWIPTKNPFTESVF